MPVSAMRFGLAVAALVSLGACADVYVPHPGPHYGEVRIPPGHMPPPGSCRVWFPDRPAGHQPPPGHCAALRHQVPPGAMLVYGR
jgi:hypothetical protein